MSDAPRAMRHLDPIDASAPEFSDLYDELPLWSAPFGMLLLERVPMRPGLTILDVGAGTGFLTLELAQRCGPRSTVIAVDPWSAAMGRLRRKVQHLELGNVRLLERDAAAMDLPDESIDVIVSNLGLHNFENADAVLGACFRAARPGARLLLTTNLAGHMAEFYEVFRATLHDMGRAELIPALEFHVAGRGTVESVRERLERAGFVAAGVERSAFRMRFADGAALLRHHFVRLGFLPAWKALAPPERIDETFERLERRLNDAATAAGELALTVPMACLEAVKPGH